jgi:pentose-5-phosphate-3-epimerase
MIAAVNVEQSKSVSVAFVSLKSMILGMIMTVSLDQNSTSFGQQCTSKIMSFSTILTIFYSLGIIVDGFCLAYFFCKK